MDIERPYTVRTITTTDLYGKKYVSFEIYSYPFDPKENRPVMHGFSEQELFDEMIHAYIEAQNSR